jgi:hypothetical protein
VDDRAVAAVMIETVVLAVVLGAGIVLVLAVIA